MHLSSFVFGFAAFTTAAVFDTAENLPDNALVWRGPAFVGGKDVYISGKVLEDIQVQLLQINPAYDAAEFAQYPKSGVEKRNTLNRRGWRNCNPPGEDIIRPENTCVEPITTLMRMQGAVRAPRGPGGCTLVTCARQCGVALCNDNNFDIWVPASNILGDWGEIKDNCLRAIGSAGLLKGQVFRDGPPSWNTLVKRHSC